MYNSVSYTVDAEKKVTIVIPAETDGGTVVLKESDSQDSDDDEYVDDDEYTEPTEPSVPSTPSEPSVPSEPSTPSEDEKPENGWYTDENGNQYFYQDVYYIIFQLIL